MPTSIPYDPSLVLASVVNDDAVKTVTAISKESEKISAAQEHMNALLATRRSLDMTKNELLNLGINVKDLEKKIEELNESLKKAAGEYVKVKIEVEDALVPLRAQIHGVSADVESPIDYVKSQIKTLPLAADSISMDVQYFSLDQNKQGSSSHSDQISSFISSSVSWMGKSASSEMSTAVSRQVNEQVQNHSVQGTLVISVSCTHKNSSVLAPLALDVDKAIKVYNAVVKDDFIQADKEGIAKIQADNKGKKPSNDKKFSIISGTTFGSSFVGMVHVLNTTSTSVSETMSSVATSMQAQMDAAAWFANVSGGWGVDASIANDVKNLLSTQNVSSHVTMICMGQIPSMVSHEVQIGVKQFATFDPKANLEALATFQNATNASHSSIQQSAAAARTGGQMVQLKQSDVKAALSALSDIDDGANKILDINSMMTALEDYLKKAAEGTGGVPLNYYLHDVTKDMLAEMWISKYYPRKEKEEKAEGGKDGEKKPEEKKTEEE